MGIISILPTVNATLNATAAILLFTGHRAIKTGNRKLHKQLMISTFSVSMLFLVCYLVYHYFHGVTTFAGTGLSRPLYFTILITHTTLAATVPFLAVISLKRGLANRIPAHVKIAKWTYPIWLYVSVTGVIVYLMLYWIFPG